MAASEVPPPPPADGGSGAALTALLGSVLDVFMSCASGSANKGQKRSRSHQTDTLVCIRRSTAPRAILTGKGRELWAFKINWRRIGGGKSDQHQTVPLSTVVEKVRQKN